MDFAIQISSYLVGLPLEILAISAILRTGFRRYPLVFGYVLAVFLTTVVEMPTALAYHSGKTDRAVTETMVANYWRDEGILQVTIFATVISLIYSASSRLASKRIVRVSLIAGAFLFVCTSFLIRYDANVRPGMWMTPWTGDLKFCAAVLDLALWALLIGSREKNRTLLLVSGGLGIMFAGGAIGESIRHLSSRDQLHWISTAGGLVVMSADMTLLYILWQVFRKTPASAQPE